MDKISRQDYKDKADKYIKFIKECIENERKWYIEHGNQRKRVT